MLDRQLREAGAKRLEEARQEAADTAAQLLRWEEHRARDAAAAAEER